MNVEEMNRLTQYCVKAKELINEKAYEDCMTLACTVMHDYPSIPHPHNWIGVILEMKGNHIQAMKHFRAAWSLDPTYLPARFNLSRYSDFHPTGVIALCDEDCGESKKEERYRVVYDESGIGHMERREK